MYQRRREEVVAMAREVVLKAKEKVAMARKVAAMAAAKAVTAEGATREQENKPAYNPTPNNLTSDSNK